jgi:hypothetical protein
MIFPTIKASQHNFSNANRYIMKLLVAITTAVSFTAFVSCNNVSKVEDESADNSYSQVDTAQLETSPLADIDTRTDLSNTSTDEEPSTDETPAESAEENYLTETEVVEVDTVATNIAYDVNRRTIEQVDTVAATKTYEVQRKVIKKKILVDTITETVSKKQQVEFEEGDYEVLNEEVVQDTVRKRIDHNDQSSAKPESEKSQDSTTKDSEQNSNEQTSEQANAASTERVEKPDTVEAEKPDSTPAEVQPDEPNIQTTKSESNEAETEASANSQENQEGEEKAEEMSPEETERRAPSYQPAQQDTTKTSEESSQ